MEPILNKDQVMVSFHRMNIFKIIILEPRKSPSWSNCSRKFHLIIRRDILSFSGNTLMFWLGPMRISRHMRKAYLADLDALSKS